MAASMRMVQFGAVVALILHFSVAMPTDAPCVDKHESCFKWATEGECAANSDWMHDNCALSCAVCVPESNDDVPCRTPRCDPMTNCMHNKMMTDSDGCDTCECEQLCPEGMIWMECGESCNATCDSPQPICTRECVARCQCPHNTVMHEGICMELSQCPSTDVGETNCRTPMCDPMTHCMHGRLMTDADGCDMCECEQPCPEGMIWMECGSACNATCDNLMPECTEECVQRCQCPYETVLHEGQCIESGQCPSISCPTVMCMPMNNCVGNRLKSNEQGCETCECAEECPTGMIWKECGSDCNSTCDDQFPICTSQCVPRCECPFGTYLHEGQCVTADQCQCPSNQVYHECGSACTKTCDSPDPMPCTMQCVARCECPHELPVWHEGECIAQTECPATTPEEVCAGGQVYHECGSACTKTCDSPDPMPCTMQCVPRCECPNELPVWHEGECITQSECPATTSEEDCVGGQVWMECGSSCEMTCDNRTPACDLSCVARCQCPRDMPIFHNGACITVSECPVPDCPSNQVYKECGSSCTPTCDEPTPRCTRQCVAHCECPAQAPIWHDGECIALDECPEPTPQCSGGQVWMECGSSCEMTCDNTTPACDLTCVPRCQCPRDMPIFHNGQCISPFQCPQTPQCPGNQEWHDCGSRCTPTCDEPIMACPAICEPRCECPRDKPLLHNGQCIELDVCPSPCSIGSSLRDDFGREYFCGRGSDRRECPDSHVCNIHPADAGAVCCSKVTGGPCHLQLQQTWIMNPPMIGMYLPQCNEDGSYSEVQCHGSTGQCWCVDENGVELEGTRVSPGQGYPECPDMTTRPACPDIDECPSGCMHEVGGDGCMRCNCEAPCSSVMCLPEYDCINRPMECETEPCEAEAICVPQLCFMSMDIGGCEEADFRESKWHFNPDTLQCENFMYMGCGGNNNNFETEDDCMNMCMPEHPICPETVCDIACDNGFKKGADGCDMCECASVRSDQCPMVRCAGSCDYGYQTDADGCQTCDCYDPCEEVTCQDHRYECLPRVAPCLVAPCPFVGKCELKLEHVSEMCKLRMYPGDCEEEHMRYYFNTEERKCLRFLWTGCHSNENNFHTLEECESNCNLPVPDGCFAMYCPQDCGAVITRTDDGCDVCDCVPVECEPLECDLNCTHGYKIDVFGTYCPICECECLPVTCEMECLHGFETDEDGCEMCQCIDPCRDVECEENEVCTLQQLACMGPDCPRYGPPICVANDLPEQCIPARDTGRCRGFFRRWYFDITTNECQMFVYGGCDGNDNRFDTPEECASTCGEHMCAGHRDCGLPEQCEYGLSMDHEKNCTLCECAENLCAECDDDSVCEHGFVKDDQGCDMCDTCYDPCQDVECEENEICKLQQLACMGPDCPQYGPPICVANDLPEQCIPARDTGRCRGFFRRWYFDVAANQCNMFVYGGCDGNDNRFDTPEECASTCGEHMCAGHRDCGLTEACEYGLSMDHEKMCTLCECAENPCVECGDTSVCEFGFAKDDQGCDICDTCYDPCQKTACSSSETCVTKIIPCEDVWCTSPDMYMTSCQPAVRPGSCPPEGAISRAISQPNCESDAFCERGEKCCRNSLGVDTCVTAERSGKLKIDMRIVLDNEFATIENIIDSFIRLAREQLARALRVPEESVTILKVEQGSIIVVAEVSVPKEEESAVVNNVMDMQNMPANSTIFTHTDQSGEQITFNTKERIAVFYKEEPEEIRDTTPTDTEPPTQKDPQKRKDDDKEMDDDDLAILIVACILLGAFAIFMVVLVCKNKCCCKKKSFEDNYKVKKQKHAHTNGVHENGLYSSKSPVSYA